MKRSLIYLTICTAFFAINTMHGAADEPTDEAGFRAFVKKVEKQCATPVNSIVNGVGSVMSKLPFKIKSSPQELIEKLASGLQGYKVELVDMEIMKRFFADKDKKDETIAGLLQDPERFTRLERMRELYEELPTQNMETLTGLIHPRTVERLQQPAGTSKEELLALMRAEKILDDGTKVPLIPDDLYFWAIREALYYVYHLEVKGKEAALSPKATAP